MVAFFVFISANDVGINGAHQEGIYLNKKAWNLFFDEPIPPTGILDKQVKIHINDWKPFESRIVYYSSKKEFRITQFWTNTPFEKSEAVGTLLVFIPVSPQDYNVYLFNTDDEMEEFIDTFSLSLLNNFAIYRKEKGQEIAVEQTLEDIIGQVIEGMGNFPTTTEMSKLARSIYRKKMTPDKNLLKWVETEYTVFRMLEERIYKDQLSKPFRDIESLIEFANMALNRRKSRAGKSLENHLNYIFASANLPFENPGRTEGNKKPDFLFPSTKEYQNNHYPENKLIMLGAKTTCKDRWRQVLNEANRIPHKHLLTLQQGISKNQMDEMNEENLTLVVPKPLHRYYPKEYQDRLWTVEQFIQYAKVKCL
ncbi:restriction endonuclease EcoRII [Ureibacillus xyleni]|uniref:Restriction endonuclease EcoRII n=1 Tax=Ureibacillus xyleni TaxID=614648 RepID=A0A285SQM9_9BACL|nr:type II restriction endonuclease [Ureibacillus xyleni]SOC08371.1 restriction endonuclease EcoRII [Ureibacillus xyleni]